MDWPGRRDYRGCWDSVECPEVLGEVNQMLVLDRLGEVTVVFKAYDVAGVYKKLQTECKKENKKGEGNIQHCILMTRPGP